MNRRGGELFFAFCPAHGVVVMFQETCYETPYSMRVLPVSRQTSPPPDPLCCRLLTSRLYVVPGGEGVSDYRLTALSAHFARSTTCHASLPQWPPMAPKHPVSEGRALV